jgi:hypothetical protein
VPLKVRGVFSRINQCFSWFFARFKSRNEVLLGIKMSVPRLDKFTYKMVLSSPACFTGEILTDTFWLTHAWPLHQNSIVEVDPSSRSHLAFFTLTFRERELPEKEEKMRQPPHYDFVGDYFCVFLSVYFGKRFDNLGFSQAHGIHCLPDIQQSKPRKLVEALPVNWRPRKDLGIKLELHEAKPLLPILEAIFHEVNDKKPVPDELELAYTAGRFYQQALQLFESDPELAYLSLVNAGEVLISGLNFSEDELYDKETQELLAEIKNKLGNAQAEKVRDRFFQIGRKFRVGLSRLVNNAFFEGSESPDDFYKFRPDDFSTRIAAAYALRSKFLHVGKRFGVWATVLDYRNAEVSIGPPAYGDAEWKKLIARIPTLAGLERVIRFCLLRFLHQRVSPLHEKLN